MPGHYKPSGPPEPTRLYDPSGKDITEKVHKAHKKKKKPVYKRIPVIPYDPKTEANEK
tara:strand:- start:394 stop:567 length:174 start_codon:yes stop_codon:yes gene_type:complete